MMENPIGFTTLPQPPLTPLFPSDFLPVRERNSRDFLKGLKALRGAYIINIFFPYFSTAKIPALFPPLPGPLTRHILSIYFFPIFSCYYSLSRQLFQGPWTSYILSMRFFLIKVPCRPRCGPDPAPVPAVAAPAQAAAPAPFPAWAGTAPAGADPGSPAPPRPLP